MYSVWQSNEDDSAESKDDRAEPTNYRLPSKEELGACMKTEDTKRIETGYKIIIIIIKLPKTLCLLLFSFTENFFF
jgi:hypothetical protein